MVKFSVLLFIASLSASGFSIPAKRTVSQVETDIASISGQVTTLDNAINSFPNTGGSLLAALAIHTDSTSLQSSLNQATSDINGTPPFSEADGQVIFTSVQSFEPKILDALKAIAGKRAAFDGLPLGGVSGLVKQDLANLRTATDAFADALIAKAPDDLKQQSTDIKNAVDVAFVSAQAAYASA